MKNYWVFRIIKGVIFVTLAVIAFGYVAMSLWNWLVPDLFHGPIISFGQAIGLVVLSKLLFGGFHGGRCCGNGGWHNLKQYWKEKMEARMANMSPEEKEKFREQMKARCGGGGWWNEMNSEKGKQE